MIIREKLKHISELDSRSTEVIIAAAILSNYDKGVFLSQKELADLCFVSNSVITNFAKKLSFTGFREFNFQLKHEYNNINVPSIIKGSEENLLYTFNIIKMFYKDLLHNTDFLKLFHDVVKLEKKVYIFSSYVLHDSASFLASLLNSKGISVIYNPVRSFEMNLSISFQNDGICLFLISGVDNDYLVDIYRNIDKEHHIEKTLIIGSKSQIDKLLHSKKNLVLNHNGRFSSYEIRRLYLDFLFITLIENFESNF